LTFTGAPPSGTNNIYVVHQAKSVGTIDVPDDIISGKTLVTADSSADHVLIEDATDGGLKKALYPSGFSVSSITGATALTATPADTDEFVLSDAGTLKRIDFSHIKGNFFAETGFYAYLNSTQTVTDNTETTITFNTEVFDLGGAFNTSTYSYTPPSTGYYYFEVSLMFKGNANDNLWKANTIIKKGDGSGNFSSFRDFENDFATAYGNKFTTTNGVIVNVDALVPYKINVFIRDQAGAPDVQGSITNSFFQGYRIA
jgi:hypothetical protein